MCAYIAQVCFYVCCSDCVNVCCVLGIVEDSVTAFLTRWMEKQSGEPQIRRSDSPTSKG